ncbi:MAG TPA: signal peptidase II [Thermomicrobiales bacterium]|nr:signal peptidase II [Thermomicrobiales bacterium]
MRFAPPMTLPDLLARVAAVMAVVVVLDLLVKWAVTLWIGPDADRHSWWLIGDSIGFEYLRNTGAAFGLFRGNPELLAAFTLLVTVGIVRLVLLEVRSPFWAALSSGLLAGGAIGNFVERVISGYVTDFVAVGPWPRFNIADSTITIGIAIFALAVILPDKFGASDQATAEEGVRDRRA